MRAEPSKLLNQSDDDLRLVRMARGARAVAAAFIVGGIVVAVLEWGASTQRARPTDATPEETRAYAVAEPHAVAAPAAPAADADSAPGRPDREEDHG